VKLSENNIYCLCWEDWVDDKEDFIQFSCGKKGYNIKNTIYFKPLNGEWDRYLEYIKITGNVNQGKSFETYSELIENFNPNRMDKIILKHDKKVGAFYIMDGTHRFSLLVFKGHPLKDEYFSIE